MLEIKLGRFLGQGGFCTVNEISKVTLVDEVNEDDTATTLLQVESSTSRTLPGYELYLGSADHNSPPVSPARWSFPNADTSPSSNPLTDNTRPVQDRTFMANAYRRRQGCRYALKRVTVTKTTDANTFVNAVVDLAVEAQFLSVLRHPHIIKMRGTALTNPFDSESRYFVVLDRLYEIFGQRLVKWRNQKTSLVSKMLTCHKKHREERLFFDRLKVAHDLADALAYLHNQKYVVRTVLVPALLTPLFPQRCVS